MADWTITNEMADIQYDLDDRFIYNDIRSQVGQTHTETVTDEVDPATYGWRLWQEYHALPSPGYTTFRYFKATQGTPLEWRLRSINCYTGYPDYAPYSNYSIAIVTTNDPLERAVEIKNTGTQWASIGYIIEYKYLQSEGVVVTHEETSYNTLMVRATDADSIRKYGRRTMNLVWPTGASETDMQGIVDRKLASNKEPVARLRVRLIGKTDALLQMMHEAEISDEVQVVCDLLGLNDTFWLDSIDLQCDLRGLPSAVWGLVDKSPTEEYAVFRLDISKLDGTDRLG